MHGHVKYTSAMRKRIWQSAHCGTNNLLIRSESSYISIAGSRSKEGLAGDHQAHLGVLMEAIIQTSSCTQSISSSRRTLFVWRGALWVNWRLIRLRNLKDCPLERCWMRPSILYKTDSSLNIGCNFLSYAKTTNMPKSVCLFMRASLLPLLPERRTVETIARCTISLI